MDASDLPGIAGLIVALAGGWFTYRASREQNKNTSRKDAVEGFDLLADDLRSDLASCRAELQASRARELVLERTEHNQAMEIGDLKRENEQLHKQLEEGT